MFHWSRLAACVVVVVGLLSSGFLGSLEAGELDVIINEIHYNPLGGGSQGDLEFLELHNLGTAVVDLSGWSFAEGLEYTFAPGTSIGPREYLVLSPDPAAARLAHGLDRVLGPYAGRLDNGGEILALQNAQGRVMNRLNFDDSGIWPALADGLGPSLEFTGEDNGNDLPARWEASAVVSGTPGSRNSQFKMPPPPVEPGGGTAIIAENSTWRTFKGRQAPSNPVTAWTQLGFSDVSWAVLPGGFGYGDDHGFAYATELNDMQGQYTTFYLRQRFTIAAADHADFAAGKRQLTLNITYDDAFVAYLNGVEVARENVGTAGTPVPNNASANGAGAARVEVPLDAFRGALLPGDNVLAVQGVNFFIFGRDFYLNAGLEASESEPEPEPEAVTALLRGLLNEYRPGGAGVGGGFLELHNPTAKPFDVAGHVVRLGSGESATIAGPAVIAPGGFLLLSAATLGFAVPANPQGCVLLQPDGTTLVDTFDPRPVGAGNSAGRFPDGDDDVFVFITTTPGSANVYTFESPVVIHEIQYHPPFVPPSGDCTRRCSDVLQWVELWNRSGADQSLTGWSLTKGVNFDFAPGTIIPAGKGLVVASSLEAFRAAHPAVQNVVGGWSGRLSHSSDTLNLRDALGNRVDHVRYGDGGPTNDEAPENQVDDRTFRGSTWPSGADGSGATLELANALIENKSGLAWRASLLPGGSPGTLNSAFEPSMSPIIDDVSHQPLVPRSNQAVSIFCRIDALEGMASVSLVWSLDGGSSSTLPMRDNGVAPDRLAGDGLFAATIPAQANRALVRFRITASDTGNRTLTLPLAPQVPPYNGAEAPYFLYEIDDGGPPANASASYRILMTQRDVDELDDRSAQSDVLLPCTVIVGDSVRQVAGLRYRGETSRNEANRSYRIDFPAESPLNGTEHLNLNGSNGGNLGISGVTEILAADIFRRAGAPYPQIEPVNVHFPGEVSQRWDSRYSRKENFDDAFLERFFGGSDSGNFYRARNPGGVGAASGDLGYLGENAGPYVDLYQKKSNREENDYSDIIELTRVFNAAQTPDAVFAAELDRLIDARQWAQFFAIQTILTNNDGGIWNNNGEDYFLYRVPADSPRPDAGKFLLLPWDLEETFTDVNARLFAHEVPSVRRFLGSPVFARLYYQELAAVRDGAFSRLEMRRRFGFVANMYSANNVFNVVDPIDGYITDRLGYLQSNVSPEFSVGPASATTPGTLLIARGEMWRFFRGLTAPAGTLLDWTQKAFDDAAWETGATGIGYGDGDDATELTDMLDNYTTVFLRKTFAVADPDAVQGLTLAVDYDDGFIAYINGNEVARSANAPATPVFSGVAGDTREAGTPESFEVAPALAELVPGPNVLAIIVFNQDGGSSDLSMIPELAATLRGQGISITGGCGGPIYATGAETVLGGLVDPTISQAVRVNGELAAFGFITGGAGPHGATWSSRVALAPGDNVVIVTVYPDVAGVATPVLQESILVTRLAGSFTEVGGTLAGDVTWTAAGGPYRLTRTAQVPTGASLTIEAGVVILAAGGAGIRVNGSLTIAGTEAAPVRLDAFTCNAVWNGIYITDTGVNEASPAHSLRHAHIAHATNQQGAPGVVTAVNARIVLDGCVLSDLGANALDATDARVEVRNSLFENIFEGVHCTRSKVVIEDTTFRNMLGDSDAIDFDATVDGRSRIASCVIEDGADDGIDLADASVDILDCTFARVADKAISLETDGSAGGQVIQRNVLHSCGTGMALKDGVTVQGDHLTITECQEGINLFAKDAGPEGGHGVFHSLIVWNNAVDVLLDSKSTLEITHSDIGGEAPWPGEGNISQAPLFASSVQGDFSLLAGSPCIASGKDSTDMGAMPFSGTPGVLFLRGDTDLNGNLGITDAVISLRFLFAGGDAPDCHDRMDSNDDGKLNITDPIHVLAYLFQGGADIPAPYPQPGLDPNPDALPCER